MINFKKVEGTECDKYDMTNVIYRAARDRSGIQNQAVTTLRNFVITMYPTVGEVNKFIDGINQLMSFIKAVLVEYSIYEKNSGVSDKRLIVSMKQEEEMFNHLTVFSDYLGLKQKIAQYVTNITNIRINPGNDKLRLLHDVTALELNSLVVLNSILTIVLSNAREEVLYSRGIETHPEEFIRLFSGFIMNMFRQGWLEVSKHSLIDPCDYQRILLDTLTNHMTQLVVSKDIRNYFNQPNRILHRHERHYPSVAA